jgi:outer membrane lipoprotein LolB
VALKTFFHPVARALAALTLGGCATLWQPLSSPTDASVEGRLAVQVHATATRQAQSLSAPFTLQGNDLAGTLELASPLGTLLARASWGPQGVTLLTPEGTQQFASLQALAESLFGEPLPLAAITAWLQGKPWPGAESQPLAPQVFTQLGWRVDASAYDRGLVQAERLEPPPQVRLRALITRP